jgi:Mrp family chromosome partitioning ATPase
VVELKDVVGSVRRHWRMSAVIVVVGLLATASYFVFTGDVQIDEDYQADISVVIPSFTEGDDGERPVGVPGVLLSGQEDLAASPQVTAQALAAAEVSDEDSGSIEFNASQSEGSDVIFLSVTAPDEELTERVANAYVSTFVFARSQIVASQAASAQLVVERYLNSLRNRLRAIEGELQDRGVRRRPPLVPIPDTSGSFDRFGALNEGATPPSADLGIPADLPLESTLLLYERNGLLNRVNQLQLRYADLAAQALSPNSFTEIAERPDAYTVDSGETPPVVPAAIGLAATLALAVGAPVLKDRLDRSVSSSKQAAAVFGAPVLSRIPALPERNGTLVAAGTSQDAAFRSLAATSVSTGRLPKAILVTSPVGATQDAVAANFAAALATLGMRVALVATNPRQDWFVIGDRDRATTLPELLALAHSGRLDGSLPQRLGRTHLDNLLFVPPGAESQDLHLSLDGLPPLLGSLASSDIDVTVIAGPPLLDDANATIMAWATGSVLWAVRTGEVAEADAREAAGRLELAGVQPFGVAIVGNGG